MRHTALLLLFALAGGALAQGDIRPTFVSGTGRSGGEGPELVCDGRTDTKWCIDLPSQMPYTIVLDAGRPVGIAEYGLSTGNDTFSYHSRNPISWRVSGSNDQKAWTLLDNRSDERGMGAENEQEYRFQPREKGSFRYYRFEFLRLAGGTRIQLSEISLHTTVRQPIQGTFVSGTGQGGREGAELVADGRLTTKWCIDAPRQMPYEVVLDAGSAVPVSEYCLATADDTHSYPGRNPIAWRVEGSNDLQKWQTVDEQKYSLRLRDENEQEFRFKASSSGSFRYYRFRFLRMSDGTRLQLSEIRLFR